MRDQHDYIYKPRQKGDIRSIGGRHSDDSARYVVEQRIGHVVTPHGFVIVRSFPWASLYEIRRSDGRIHLRWEDRSRTARGLTIMAGKFAEEVFSDDS